MDTTDHSHDRRDIDDCAGAGREHVWADLAGAVEAPRWPDSQRPLPAFGLELDGGCSRTDACVVDEDIDPAMGLRDGSDYIADLSLGGHVEFVRFAGVELARNRLSSLWIEVGDDDVRARSGKRMCCSAPDTGAGAGYDRHATVEALEISQVSRRVVHRCAQCTKPRQKGVDMRIKYIVPFPFDDEGIARRAEQLPETLRTPGVDYDFVPVRNSIHNADSAYELLILDAYIAEAGLRSEDEGYDAVVMDTVSDSGLGALRSRLSIPVLGPGLVQQHVAAMLGKRFSILTMWRRWISMYEKDDGRVPDEPLLRLHSLYRRSAQTRSSCSRGRKRPCSRRSRSRVGLRSNRTGPT